MFSNFSNPSHPSFIKASIDLIRFSHDGDREDPNHIPYTPSSRSPERQRQESAPSIGESPIHRLSVRGSSRPHSPSSPNAAQLLQSFRSIGAKSMSKRPEDKPTSARGLRLTLDTSARSMNRNRRPQTSPASANPGSASTLSIEFRASSSISEEAISPIDQTASPIDEGDSLRGRCLLSDLDALQKREAAQLAARQALLVPGDRTTSPTSDVQWATERQTSQTPRLTSPPDSRKIRTTPSQSNEEGRGTDSKRASQQTVRASMMARQGPRPSIVRTYAEEVDWQTKVAAWKMSRCEEELVPPEYPYDVQDASRTVDSRADSGSTTTRLSRPPLSRVQTDSTIRPGSEYRIVPNHSQATLAHLASDAGRSYGSQDTTPVQSNRKSSTPTRSVNGRQAASDVGQDRQRLYAPQPQRPTSTAINKLTQRASSTAPHENQSPGKSRQQPSSSPTGSNHPRVARYEASPSVEQSMGGPRTRRYEEAVEQLSSSFEMVQPEAEKTRRHASEQMAAPRQPTLSHRASAASLKHSVRSHGTFQPPIDQPCAVHSTHQHRSHNRCGSSTGQSIGHTPIQDGSLRRAPSITSSSGRPSTAEKPSPSTSIRFKFSKKGSFSSRKGSDQSQSTPVSPDAPVGILKDSGFNARSAPAPALPVQPVPATSPPRPRPMLSNDQIQLTISNSVAPCNSLFGFRRRLVSAFPDLGISPLKTAILPASRTRSRPSTADTVMSEPSPCLPSSHEDAARALKRAEEKLQAREAELTVEALCKEERACVDIEVYTQFREGAWMTKGIVRKQDLEAIPLRSALPPLADVWSLPIDAKGILARGRVKSRIELGNTRSAIRRRHLPDSADPASPLGPSNLYAGEDLMEMIYAVNITLRRAGFYPLKLPSAHLLGIRSRLSNCVDAPDELTRSEILRARALDYVHQAAEKIAASGSLRPPPQSPGATHVYSTKPSPGRILLAKAKLERKGVTTVRVLSRWNTRYFEIVDNDQGPITELSEEKVKEMGLLIEDTAASPSASAPGGMEDSQRAPMSSFGPPQYPTAPVTNTSMRPASAIKPPPRSIFAPPSEHSTLPKPQQQDGPTALPKHGRRPSTSDAVPMSYRVANLLSSKDAPAYVDTFKSGPVPFGRGGWHARKTSGSPPFTGGTPLPMTSSPPPSDNEGWSSPTFASMRQQQQQQTMTPAIRGPTQPITFTGQPRLATMPTMSQQPSATAATSAGHSKANGSRTTLTSEEEVKKPGRLKSWLIGGRK